MWSSCLFVQMYPPTIPYCQTVIAAEWPPHTVKALWISFQLDAKTAKHWWLWSLNSKSLVQLCIHTLALFPKRRGGFLTGINTENFMPLLLFGEKLPSSSSSSPTTSFSAFIIRPINPKEFQGCSNDLANHLTCSTVIDRQKDYKGKQKGT